MPTKAPLLPPRQRGMALVVVLLILAVAVVIAAAMTERLGLQIRRADNLVSYSQAQQYAQGAEQFAMAVLKQDFKDSPNAVHLGQYWSSGEQIYPLENGLLIGRITDLQACFNLNAAAGRSPQQPSETPPLEMTALQQLLEQAGVESYAAETIAHSTRDWLDADDTISGSLGAEDGEYRGLQPPYVTANSLMADVSEWRLVRGVTAEIYQQLRPMVCVLPGQLQLLLNVNTIAPEHAALLAGVLGPEVTLDIAQQLLDNRPKTGWETTNEFWAAPELQAVQSSLKAEQKALVSVNSHYFAVEVETQIDRARFRHTAILRREGNQKLTVIQRRIGGKQ